MLPFDKKIKEQGVFSMSAKQIPASDLPFCLPPSYGTITHAEMICPGVYYVAASLHDARPCFPREYYVVTAGSPAVSTEALSYCTPLDAVPSAYICLLDYDDKGRHVVAYEVYKYMADHGIPLPCGESLTSTRVFGMEVCPEYFGAFPVPEETPWGPALRSDCLANGLFWLETAQAGRVLAIAYPLCTNLFDDTLELAHLLPYDQEHGIDATCGYRFYLYEESCRPLFELCQYEELPPKKLQAFLGHDDAVMALKLYSMKRQKRRRTK